MTDWSENLKETTRNEIFTGAMVKNLNHEYGFFVYGSNEILIMGVDSESAFMPVASTEVIARFNGIEEMIQAGWVID